MQTANMKQVVISTTSSLQDYLQDGAGIVKILASQQSIWDVLEGKENPNAAKLLQSVVSDVDGIWTAIVFNESEKVIQGCTASGKDLAGTPLKDKVFMPLITKHTTDDVVIGDTVFKSDQGANYLVCISKRVKNENGKFIGWAVIFPNWGEFAAKTFDNLRIGENGYGFMYDSEGRVIAHGVNKDKMLTSVGTTDRFKKIKQSQKGLFEYEYEGRTKLMAYDTLPENGWIVAMSAYDDDLAATAIQQRNVMIIGGIFVVALIITVTIFLLRKLVLSPTNNILGYAKQIASGDLNARLSGTYKYELATLADAIQAMVSDLKNKLGFSQGVLKGMTIPCALFDAEGNVVWANEQIRELVEEKRTVEQLKGVTSGDFYYGEPNRKSMVNTAINDHKAFDVEIEHTFPSGRATILRVSTTPFYDMDNQLLGAVSNLIDLTEIRTQQKQIQEQNTKISQAAAEAESISQHLATAAEELSAQVEQASKGAAAQRDRMAETATAMNQMNASVLEVARNASEASQVTADARKEASLGATNLGNLIKTIGEVHKQAVSLKDSMGKLGDQAQDIGNVMNVITDIADQTNLLALNAAIEAARAGEAGRGFAVVADEVRKLAEKTMDATKEVGSAIANIQSVADLNIQATENAVLKIAESTELAGKSGEVLNAIVQLMDNAASQVSGIATAAEEQSSTSEQINHSAEEVNQLSQEASEVMDQSASAVQDVARMAAELTQVIETMS